MPDVYDVYSLVRSIRRAEFPRNRNFDAHATGAGAAARRLHRFLRGVERDVTRANDVLLRRAPDGSFLITMRFQSVRLERRVLLSRAEYALLVEDDRVRARLDQAAAVAPA